MVGIVDVDSVIEGGSSISDVCVLPQPPAPSLTGVVLDYEVQDGRSPEQTLAFLRDYAELVKSFGKRVMLYSNPLDAPTQKYTGIDETNAHTLHHLYDKTGILLWHKNRQRNVTKSFLSQYEILGATGSVSPGQLMLVFELNQTTLFEAHMADQLMDRFGIDTVMLWRNRAKVGGPCEREVNLKIACVTQGDCAKENP
jgi:hypothetical protein